MSKRERSGRPGAVLPRGLRDAAGPEVRALRRMIDTISGVYELHGFEPLATPAIEFTEALGKFLPDQDRPNEGVFSFLDDDEQWLSLRYDLTAPLARYVAENFDRLPKPFRRYQSGPVWRNEKPGPGRFREFLQIDADTVGTASPAADAEMCMLAADALEALGLGGSYVVRVSNRKILEGLREAIAPSDPTSDGQWLTILRAMDKLDRLSEHGVRALLGKGRKDESGDVTKGAGLSAASIEIIMGVFEPIAELDEKIAQIDLLLRDSGVGQQGREELEEIQILVAAAGYGDGRIVIDPSVVRGLEYYTGPVFEAELTFDIAGDDGRPIRFGSVGGGGRYDGLVARFRGQEVPATGFSMGVSRLYAALEHLGRHDAAATPMPVVVLVMDPAGRARYEAMARELRAAGIRAETYLGTSGLKAQMKYADRRGAPAVVMEGAEERGRGEVTIKDLALGAALSQEIEGRQEWRDARPAQVSVARDRLVPAVAAILARGSR
jgi:histidyl-tRNA synthetase